MTAGGPDRTPVRGGPPVTTVTVLTVRRVARHVCLPTVNASFFL